MAKSNHKKSTILSEKSDKPKADKARHYVDNAAFVAALEARKVLVEEALAKGEPKPRITEYLGGCILKIAVGLSKHKSFVAKPYIDDMIGDGIRNCILYIDNFNTEKSTNAFSYFTQICSYAFINRIDLEEKALYRKFKATMNQISIGTLGSHDVGDPKSEELESMLKDSVTPEDYMLEFIEKYEKKLDKRKQKVAAKKKGLKFKKKEETTES